MLKCLNFAQRLKFKTDFHSKMAIATLLVEVHRLTLGRSS